jgi:choline dehydrogenase-like flavoprotein
MIIDAKKISSGQLISADVCIVGAGAAGISMGLELNNTRLKVVILESGGFEFDKQIQSLYTGESEGHENFPLEMNRLRYFGGTTGHWDGHCRPFDQFDLSKRDWIPHSGWPIKIDELEPYLRKAQPLFGLGKYEYDALPEYAEKLGLKTLPFAGGRLISVMKMKSPPTRFGTEYREKLKKSKNVTVYLHSNVLELVAKGVGEHITHAKITCIDGPKYKVKAKKFVLAAGGLENARLMLLSDKVATTGLGNSHDLVGRYYADHLMILPVLNVSLSRTDLNTDLYDASKRHHINRNTMYGILTASEALMRREKLPRFRLHFYNSKPKYRAKNGVGRVFARLDDATAEVKTDTNESSNKKSTDVSSIALHMVMEPVPNPQSRVTLIAQKDFLGQRKIKVNWQVTDTELAYAHRIAEITALEFARMGYGRSYGSILAKPNLWPEFFRPGKHHCGTTRMSDNPKTGVVDRHCRVFDVDNLYIAGSSVFPTIGHTNPTLNLVALALRLANHLKKEIL